MTVKNSSFFCHTILILHPSEKENANFFFEKY